MIPIIKRIYQRLKKNCTKININVDNELSIIDSIESGKIEEREKAAVEAALAKEKLKRKSEEGEEEEEEEEEEESKNKSSEEKGKNNKEKHPMDNRKSCIPLTPREK